MRMQALKIPSVKKKKGEVDLKRLSLHLLILRETLLGSQNKSLPVTYSNNNYSNN